eukprot:5801460-Pyramimonas_sp.AAC.1
MLASPPNALMGTFFSNKNFVVLQNRQPKLANIRKEPTIAPEAPQERINGDKDADEPHKLNFLAPDMLDFVYAHRAVQNPLSLPIAEDAAVVDRREHPARAGRAHQAIPLGILRVDARARRDRGPLGAR